METINIKKTDKTVIELFCGRTRHGQVFYAYLAIPREKYMRYHAFVAMKKPINLKEFGEIIECGFSSAEDFNASHARMRAPEYNHDLEMGEMLHRRVG